MMGDEDVTIEGYSEGPQPQAHEPVALLISRQALESIWQHADSDTSREIGGVLVGKVVSGPGGTVVEVEEAWPARYTEASSIHVKFTHETWEDWHSQLDRRDDGIRIVGWYHSHPGLGIFLSEHDTFIHRHFFNQLWQVAVVVDPVSRQLGCFGWTGQDVSQLPQGAVYFGLDRPREHPKAVSEPREPAAPAQPQGGCEVRQEAVARSSAERLWWLGWGVALATFIVLIVQVYGAAKEAPGHQALREVSSLRSDIRALRQELEALKQKQAGRWYRLLPGETLEDVCQREYKDRNLAAAVALINRLNKRPVPGAEIWLPSADALLQPATGPERARPPGPGP